MNGTEILNGIYEPERMADDLEEVMEQINEDIDWAQGTTLNTNRATVTVNTQNITFGDNQNITFAAYGPHFRAVEPIMHATVEMKIKAMNGFEDYFKITDLRAEVKVKEGKVILASGDNELVLFEDTKYARYISLLIEYIRGMDEKDAISKMVKDEMLAIMHRTGFSDGFVDGEE